LEKERDGSRLKLATLNVTGYQELAGQLKIVSTPAILIYKDAKEMKRFIGEGLNL